MAIYGIGANYSGQDVSEEFINYGIVATGWDSWAAPDLHEYFKELKAGDIVYIKACSYSSNITIKGVGMVTDQKLLDSSHASGLVEIGRNVKWFDQDWHRSNRPARQKNNVRGNTIYREFHPEIIDQINKILDHHL